jgi:serine/threonine protein kinase
MSTLTRAVGALFLMIYPIQLNFFLFISGKLPHIDQLFPVSLKSAMINYGLPEPEATSAAAFISVCLHLDPEERSSASDLLDHPWLEMAHMSC